MPTGLWSRTRAAMPGQLGPEQVPRAGRSQALDSTLVGETRKWREFGSCNGTTEWNYDGNAVGGMESYEGCSATANWDQS
eukprot:8937986-Pyramimonas_sp.AAC.1